MASSPSQPVTGWEDTALSLAKGESVWTSRKMSSLKKWSDIGMASQGGGEVTIPESVQETTG